MGSNTSDVTMRFRVKTDTFDELGNTVGFDSDHAASGLPSAPIAGGYFDVSLCWRLSRIQLFLFWTSLLPKTVKILSGSYKFSDLLVYFHFKCFIDCNLFVFIMILLHIYY